MSSSVHSISFLFFFASVFLPPTTSLPASCSCGLENVATRIIGGREVTNRQPWMVGIVIDGKEDTSYCGGTLINDRFVLTAAHCVAGVPKQSIGVKLAVLTLAEMKRKNSEQVDDVIFFAYERETGKNDLALIKLQDPVPISASIAPVCLPSENDFGIPEENFVTGWGLTSAGGRMSQSLQEINLPLISQQICNKMWWDFDMDSQICAGSESRSACRGDSGGPLLSRTSQGRVVQLGITSYSSSRCDDVPTVFTSVPAFTDAIRSAVKRADYLDGARTLWCS